MLMERGTPGGTRETGQREEEEKDQDMKLGGNTGATTLEERREGVELRK